MPPQSNTFVLLYALLFACALPAQGQTHYVDLQGKQRHPPFPPITLTGGNAVTLEEGWYLCKGPLKYTNTLVIRGDVNLILGDDCDMRVTGNSVSGSYSAGIKVVDADRLTVWAQWAGSTAGRLVASGGYASAGIGGGYKDTGGVITLNGGTVNAEGGGGAGIGSGYQGVAGVITIHGGVVNATGSSGSAGIGGGEHGNGGTVNIHGGMINATGGRGGAGIGGGYEGTGYTLTIHSGIVNASSDGGGAGIGSGPSGHGGTVAIYGGTVNATGGDNGAGIGGDDSTVTILGGVVNATGGVGGAGIGGHAHGDGDAIAIHGGVVSATGGSHGAGIGGGQSGVGGKIEITGSAHITAKGNDGGANIGQGRDKDGKPGFGISTIPSPIHVTVAVDDDATFAVQRTAAATAYQWQQSVDGGKNWLRVTDGPAATGATRATLYLPGVTARMNGHLYRCVVKIGRMGKDSSIIYTTSPGRLGVRQ